MSYNYYGYGYAYGYYGYGYYGYGGNHYSYYGEEGYTSTFGGNFLVDRIPYGSYDISVYSSSAYGSAGDTSYYGFASRTINADYYSVTKYASDYGYYSHKTGYLSEPGSAIQENYSNFRSYGGASYAHYSSQYSYSASGTFMQSTYKESIYSNPNGSTYSIDSQALFHNDLHGNSGTHTTYGATYTDAQGYSYYSHGHS